MKLIQIILPIMLFAGCQSKSQVKSEIDKAFELVDEGLERVRSQEYQDYYQKLENSVQAQQQILTLIKNEEALSDANSIIKITDEIESKIDEIVQSLEAAYTLNEQGQFNNKRDKTGVNRILLEEKNGNQLKEIIEANSIQLKQIERHYMGNTIESIVTIDHNLINIKETSWAEYNFKDMPVTAVVPILKKIRNDATINKLNLLELVLGNSNR